jgi:hypothetical protein
MRRELDSISHFQVMRTQIKNLNRRAVHLDGTRDSRERREINLGCLRVRSGQFRHERRLVFHRKTISRGHVQQTSFRRTFPTEGKPTNPTDAIPVLLVDA